MTAGMDGFDHVVDVLVVGSSLGGWIAANLATRDPARIGALVLIDAVGIDVPEEPIADFFALEPRGLAEHAFHDAERFYAEAFGWHAVDRMAEYYLTVAAEGESEAFAGFAALNGVDRPQWLTYIAVDDCDGIAARCAEHPAFQAAHPDRQPDAAVK